MQALLVLRSVTCLRLSLTPSAPRNAFIGGACGASGPAPRCTSACSRLTRRGRDGLLGHWAGRERGVWRDGHKYVVGMAAGGAEDIDVDANRVVICGGMRVFLRACICKLDKLS